jgi:hypothetical protein
MGAVMRIYSTLTAGALALALTTTAGAQTGQVSVTIGPELQAKASEKYGVREVERLADSLRRDVERALAKRGGGRAELVLVDAKPNRPTFKQMSDKPGLSFQSFGIGGATIEGRIVTADGRETPFTYRWYESDIRNVMPTSTWGDAERAFDRAARRIARGAG